MVRSLNASKKYVPISTVVASFAGMLMAVPLAYALGSPANIAAAGQNQHAVSQVSQADFAKFAYAFNQGYEARTANVDTSSAAPGACADASVVTPGVGVAAARSDGGGGGSAQAMTVSAPMRYGGGMGAAYAPQHAPKMSSHESKRWMSMLNSYNSYVYNSSTVTNTNSNNTLGSNNLTNTSIAVKDSKNVMVGVSNDPTVTQMNASNSFNKDSYNSKTETNTSIVNDSFNKQVTIDSGNATATTNTTNVAKDSFNTTDVTNTTNSNNTTSTDVTSNTEVNSTEHTTTNSNNTTSTDVTSNTETTNINNTNVGNEVTLPEEGHDYHKS